MTKCFLPTRVGWPDFRGRSRQTQDLEELRIGDYLIIADCDGKTAIRLDGLEEKHYNICVLYESGFIDEFRLQRPKKLTGQDLMEDWQSKVVFEFKSFKNDLHEMHVFKKDRPEYAIIDKIFDKENRPKFRLGLHRTNRVQKIDINVWPENEPIFIVDNGHNQRLLFLQEFIPEENYRKMTEFFRSGVTNKIICETGYIRIDGQLEVGEDLYFRSDIYGISGSIIDFVSIRVYV